jgi:hypothetical protein
MREPENCKLQIADCRLKTEEKNDAPVKAGAFFSSPYLSLRWERSARFGPGEGDLPQLLGAVIV